MAKYVNLKEERLRSARADVEGQGIPTGRALTLAASLLEGTPRPKVRTELEPATTPIPAREDAPMPKTRSVGQRLAKSVAGGDKKKTAATNTEDTPKDALNEGIALQNT